MCPRAGVRACVRACAMVGLSTVNILEKNREMAIPPTRRFPCHSKKSNPYLDQFVAVACRSDKVGVVHLLVVGNCRSHVRRVWGVGVNQQKVGVSGRPDHSANLYEMPKLPQPHNAPLSMVGMT